MEIFKQHQTTKNNNKPMERQRKQSMDCCLNTSVNSAKQQPHRGVGPVATTTTAKQQSNNHKHQHHTGQQYETTVATKKHHQTAFKQP